MLAELGRVAADALAHEGGERRAHFVRRTADALHDDKVSTADEQKLGRGSCVSRAGGRLCLGMLLQRVDEAIGLRQVDPRIFLAVND